MFFSALRKLKQSKRLIRGFTLIELLVVISIIGLLTAVATVSYTNVQKKSRDGKRKADIAAIQQALAVFYSDNGAYPDEGWDASDLVAGREKFFYDRVTCKTDGTGRGGEVGNVGIVAGTAFICNSKTYMNKMPADPVTGLGYYYETDDTFCNSGFARCQRYTLWAHLENINDPDKYVENQDSICDFAKAAVGGGDYIGLAASHYDGNYCVHNPK